MMKEIAIIGLVIFISSMLFALFIARIIDSNKDCGLCGKDEFNCNCDSASIGEGEL